MKNIKLLLLLIILGFVPRVWRLPWDLQIHYDQGMHSMAVRNIYVNGRISLLGHPTDQDGIFHAPVYYFLMVPAYLFGGGDPYYPALFQVILCLMAAPFIYAAANRLFGGRSALLASAVFLFSYGLISYSRWLSNVTPAWLFSSTAIYYSVKIYLDHEYKYLPYLGFFTALVFEMNAAIGAFMYPFFLFLILKSPKHKIISLILSILPHLPLIIFELRHRFVIYQALLNMPHASSGYMSVFINNLRVLTEELTKVFFFPYSGITLILILISGLYLLKNIKNRNTLYIILYTILFLSPLALFKRGAIGFFLVPMILVFIILISRVIISLPKFISLSFIVVFFIFNVYEYGHFFKPDFALTPIGTFNLITNQDRKNIVDFIYRDSAGKPFSVWIYTIPYFHDEPWNYYFVWYGAKKYGYLPEKTADFSPGELHSSVRFYAIYEPDDNHPITLQSWLSNVTVNFGQYKESYVSADARVMAFDLPVQKP